MSNYRSLVGFNPIMTDVLSQGLLRIHLSLVRRSPKRQHWCYSFLRHLSLVELTFQASHLVKTELSETVFKLIVFCNLVLRLGTIGWILIACYFPLVRRLDSWLYFDQVVNFDQVFQLRQPLTGCFLWCPSSGPKKLNEKSDNWSWKLR